MSDQSEADYGGINGIESGNHALLCGIVWGALMKAGIDALPIVQGRNYTNQIVITRPSGRYLLEITAMDTEDQDEHGKLDLQDLGSPPRR